MVVTDAATEQKTSIESAQKVFLDANAAKELVEGLNSKHEQEIEDSWNRAY